MQERERRTDISALIVSVLSHLFSSPFTLSHNASSYFLSYNQIKKMNLFFPIFFSDLVFLCHLHPPLSSHFVSTPCLVSFPHVSSSSAVFSSHFFMSYLSSSPHHPIFFNLFSHFVPSPLFCLISYFLIFSPRVFFSCFFTSLHVSSCCFTSVVSTYLSSSPRVSYILILFISHCITSH